MRVTYTDKKNALIDAMAKRVSGASQLNAKEVLASAGISNNRLDRAALKAKSGEMRGSGTLVKENASAVAHIIRSMRIKREELTSRHGKSGGAAARKMIGKTNFNMPTQGTLEDTYFAQLSEKKRRLITSLAAGEKSMEGKISLKDYDSKLASARQSQADPVQEYVKHFSERQ